MKAIRGDTSRVVYAMISAWCRATSWTPQVQSRQQRGRFQRPRLPPCQLRVVTAERLLPAELDQRTQQAESELGIPPAGGGDAVSFQRRPVGQDALFLRLREPAAVDGQVPCQVTRRRSPPG